MHRVTGGNPLLFETRENVLDVYPQLCDSHPAALVALLPSTSFGVWGAVLVPSLQSSPLTVGEVVQ